MKIKIAKSIIQYYIANNAIALQGILLLNALSAVSF